MINQAEELVPILQDGRVVDLPKHAADLLKSPKVKVSIDGKEVVIERARLGKNPVTGEDEPRAVTIYDAALQAGVQVPVLCHREHMTPVAVCRFCAVEVNVGGRKNRTLVAACHRQVEDGMEVKTHKTSELVRHSVQILTELLMADNSVPRSADREYASNELRDVAREFLGGKESRFPRAAGDRGQDESSVVIAVDHNACILCDRCVRGCNEIRDNQVLGRMGKGFTARIAFDLDDPMGKSSCVSCGECMVSCPTGALTHRKYVGADPWEKVKPKPQPVEADDLFRHGLFEGVSRPFMDWNKGQVVRRRFKKGEIICREGESGNTAFLIEDGELEVYIQSPIKHAKADRKAGYKHGLFGLMRRFTTGLVGEEEDDTKPRYVHIDAPVALKISKNAKPVAVLTKEDVIFGEMTCMNNYPRSATVRAKTDCTLLEMTRNVLYVVQRSKKAKEILDHRYRRRAIDSHLRSVPLFADSIPPKDFDAFVNDLRDKVSLIRLNPGDVVFRQGDPADHFYLVRVGFVKVSQKQPGGEHVLNYVGPGGYSGEIGLMSHLDGIKELAPPGLRTATISALDHVDLVCITSDVFNAILKKYPSLEASLKAKAIETLQSNAETLRKVAKVPLGDFLQQGLFEARSLLVLDLEKCTRCDECTKACADAHGGVTRLVREGLRFENYLVASSCRACLDPYCLIGCPVDAIHRRNNREIIIEDWCIGCANCANNCPYGNINMVPFPTGEMVPDADNPGRKVPVVQQKATMCDLCTGLPDKQPSCVYACPHDAAHRMTGEELMHKAERRMARKSDQ